MAHIFNGEAKKPKKFNMHSLEIEKFPEEKNTTEVINESEVLNTDEAINEDEVVNTNEIVENIIIENNNILLNQEPNDRYSQDIIGKGQIYKTQEIMIDVPKNDVVIGIDTIERDVYVQDIEIANGIASLVVVISESIVYSTCKKDLIEKLELNDRETEIENECLCVDGVVRASTSIIPYKMIVDVPGATENSEYSILDATISATNTKYILQNGEIVSGNIQIDDYIAGVQEGYIVSVRIKIY